MSKPDTNQPDHIVDMHEMVINTNQASELYELCKEVYERTGWEQEPDISYLYKYWDNHDELCVISIEEAGDALIPAYTSDYLLEKLQSWFYDMGASDFGQFNVTMLADVYIAKVRGHDGEFSEQAAADTPLKALLKLTIALDKAGVKL